MSRFIQALCAFIVAATPVVAIASQSPEFERRDAFRHAINPLIGDASFIARYGAPPAPGTDPELRVHTHLSFVHELLSQRDTSALPAALREARRENLARLRAYIDAGVFPHNTRYRDRNRPCFIDDDGRICAVGYLVEQSAGRDVAERINDKFQYAFLSEIESPEVEQWIAASGLSRLELSLIQPCYAPEFAVTIAWTSEMNVTIRGVVYDDCDCGVKYTMFDFGDALWASPKSYFGASVNITHTYSIPGAYVIKGYAVSTDMCGNQLRTRTWTVNVGAVPMKLSVIELPGGPPYQAYLATNEELRTECMSSATVQWHTNESPQQTSWYLENGVYRTPNHVYSTGGVKSIWIATNYLANCSTNQWAAMSVNINGVSGSAQDRQLATTWGAIKAMYR